MTLSISEMFICSAGKHMVSDFWKQYGKGNFLQSYFIFIFQLWRCGNLTGSLLLNLWGSLYFFFVCVCVDAKYLKRLPIYKSGRIAKVEKIGFYICKVMSRYATSWQIMLRIFIIIWGASEKKISRKSKRVWYHPKSTLWWAVLSLLIFHFMYKFWYIYYVFLIENFFSTESILLL